MRPGSGSGGGGGDDLDSALHPPQSWVRLLWVYLSSCPDLAMFANSWPLIPSAFGTLAAATLTSFAAATATATATIVESTTVHSSGSGSDSSTAASSVRNRSAVELPPLLSPRSALLWLAPELPLIDPRGLPSPLLPLLHLLGVRSLDTDLLPPQPQPHPQLLEMVQPPSPAGVVRVIDTVVLGRLETLPALLDAACADLYRTEEMAAAAATAAATSVAASGATAGAPIDRASVGVRRLLRSFLARPDWLSGEEFTPRAQDAIFEVYPPPPTSSSYSFTSSSSSTSQGGTNGKNQAADVAVVVVFSALTRHHFLPPFDATLPAVLLGPQFVHCGGRGEEGTTDTSHHTSHQAALLDALGVGKLSRPQFHTEHFLPRLPRLDPGVRDGTMQHVLLDLQRLCREEGGGGSKRLWWPPPSFPSPSLP